MCGKYFDGELLNGYTTIFGETSFTNMGVTLVEATNKYIYDEISKSIKVLFPQVMIDQNRLEKWVKLCLKLENIPESELIDMVSLKKITDLEAKLAEKDKIIEAQHNGIGYWKSVAEKRPNIDYVFKIKDLEQQLAEKEKEYQDAISNFVSLENARAILQLEKVKWIVEDIQYTNGNDDNISRDFLINEINNQIKQLKEMK